MRDNRSGLVCIFIALAAIMLFTQCNNPSPAKKPVKDTTTTTTTTATANKPVVKPAGYEPVSMISLIAAPEKYDGKPVSVIGYLDMQPEKDVIYLQREDHDYKLARNCIGIEIAKTLRATYHYKRCNKKYIFVEGIFSTKITKPESFNGAIVNINKLEIHNYD